MTRWGAIVVLVVLAQAGHAQGQECPGQPQQRTIPQESYVRISRPGQEPPWIYLYAPSIHPRFLQAGFRPFELWLIEGTYGRVFREHQGSLSESEFAKTRESQGVRARKILTARFDDKTGRPEDGTHAIGVPGGMLFFKVVHVGNYVFTADTVTVQICQ